MGEASQKEKGGDGVEREKLAELFRVYADDVYRLAYSYLGSRADAEDVCQNVFLKLADGRTELWPGREKAWLLKSTANLCKNHLKSFWQRNVEELSDAIPFRETADRALHDAVMTLPPGYRAVIHLYYFEGYDQGEIGEILRLSRTAVQTRMSRARAMLKKELNDDEELLPTYDGTGQPG